MEHGAELLLSLHACLFSTPHYKTIGTLMAAGGLLLASTRGRSPRVLLLLLPLILGAIASLVYGTALGPSLEACGILAGAYGWYLAGTGPSPGRGLISSACAIILSVLSCGEWLLTREAPRLWMVSPIDCGIAILLQGIFGFRAQIIRYRRLFHFSSLGTVLAVIASTSRALGIAAAAALFLLIPGRRRLKIALVALFLLAALPSVISRVRSDPLAWHRSSIYLATSSLIMERPWTGWGLGSFDAVSRRALLPDPLEIRRMRSPVYAHNDFLELAMEIGLPLACAALAAWLFLILATATAGYRTEAAFLVAVSLLSLFYFPLRLVYPLFHAFHAAGSAFPLSPAPARSRFPLVEFSMAGLLMLYALGLQTRSHELAPYDARIAIESRSPTAVDDFLKLESERPEAWVAAAMRSSRSGSPDDAIRGFESAVGKSPTESPIRFELARAWLWKAEQAERNSDTMTATEARRRLSHQLGFIRT
ncbi:MAG: O-antigen ligase family protein, partial [Candidatus Hydrogenedentota bacterium]